MTRSLILLVLLGMTLASNALARQIPLGTGFTYQGQLKSGGSAYSGSADFTFALFDVAAGGSPLGSTLPISGVSVTNGTFSVSLDFGALAFNGDERWLEIAVRTPPTVTFTTLIPRQQLTATPYALRALNASISGIQPSALTFTNATNAYSGSTLNIDAGTLQVDSANHVVGIGGTSPLARLNVATANRPVGVWVENTSNTGSVDTGVYGSAMDYGGFFQSTSNGGDAIGVYGLASNTSGLNYGVLGRSLSPQGYAGYFDGALTYVSQRLGIATQSPTHQLTVFAPDAETMRLFGSQGSFGHGARLNFGDGDYAYLEEDIDDALRLRANRLEVSSPFTGDDALVLPGGSVSSGEMFDEPGVASEVRIAADDGIVALGFGITTISTAVINAPGPGYVIALAHAQCSNINSPTTVAASFAIGTSTFTFPTERLYVQHVYNPNENFLMEMHRVIPVAAAGSFSVHFLGSLATPDTPLSIINSRLTLLYVPTAYGIVETGNTASALARAAVPPPDAADAGAVGVEEVAGEPISQSDLHKLQAEVAELRRQMQELLNQNGRKP